MNFNIWRQIPKYWGETQHQGYKNKCSAYSGLIDIAQKEGLVVLTHDSDFGKIVFTNKGIHIGIIYLRPGHTDPIFYNQTLNSLFKTDLKVFMPFMLVAENTETSIKVRIRNL